MTRDSTRGQADDAAMFGLSALTGGVIAIGISIYLFFPDWTATTLSGLYRGVAGGLSTATGYVVSVSSAVLPVLVGAVAVVIAVSAVRGSVRTGNRLVIDKGGYRTLDPGVNFVHPLRETHRVPKEGTLSRSLDGVRAADGTPVETSYEVAYRVDDPARFVDEFGSDYESELRSVIDEQIRDVIGDRPPEGIAADDGEFLGAVEDAIDDRLTAASVVSSGVVSVEYVDFPSLAPASKPGSDASDDERTSDTSATASNSEAESTRAASETERAESPAMDTDSTERTVDERAGRTATGSASGPTDTDVFERFEREELLGSGGNADVYRATGDVDGDERTVALKLPTFPAAETVEVGAFDEFTREAETWAKLDDHDHVVAVYDWGTTPQPWLALEYMAGGSLAERTPLNPERGRDVLDAMTEALEHAHRQGVIHGDIKPANVLFTDSGRPKLGDWGLAKVLLEHSQSMDGLSPAYAAPEQFDEGATSATDHQLIDIYQLGAVAYELFTGRPPFEGTTFQVIDRIKTESPPPPSDVRDLPPWIDDLVLTALAKDPDERFDTVVHFRDAM